jgi:hypothetical protein
MIQHHIPEEQVPQLYSCKTLNNYFSYLLQKMMLTLQNTASVTLQTCYCRVNEHGEHSRDIHTAINLSSSTVCKILSQKEKLKAAADVSVGGTKSENIMQTTRYYAKITMAVNPLATS